MSSHRSQLPIVDFKARITALEARLSGQPILLFAQPQGYRNSTVESTYRQDSSFYYLTGFSESDAALLIRPDRPWGEGKVSLFLRKRDPVWEMWNGYRLGVDEATNKLAVDQAHPIDDIWTKLPELLQGYHSIFYSLGLWPDQDRKVLEVLRKVRTLGLRSNPPLMSVRDSMEVVAPLRLIKEPVEVARMKEAARITKIAFETVLKGLRPGINEREVHGVLLGEFLKNGADMEAYGSIVAGGPRAWCLHYRDNNQDILQDQLVLIDAGCQVDNYASDVTRTFPLNRKMTSIQKDLYSIVLESQKAAFQECKVGSTWHKVQLASFRSLSEGLSALKLLDGSVDEILEKQTYKKFCPHSISHWIGLDVHDAGVYSVNGEHTKFVPGMYFSVEPGFYVNESDESVPAAYRGIGIRIEDDVLITSEGCDVVTGLIPKELKDLGID